MQTPHTLRSSVSQRPLLNYWLYLPSGYASDAGRNWPLILFLHGFGERGDSLADLELVKLHGIPRALESGLDLPFIVVSPQCSRYSWWTLQNGQLVTLLDFILGAYAVNPAQVYLTGLSMGGSGAWQLGMARPERFAALAPICGAGMHMDAPALKDVPVWAFHGGADDIVPLHCSQLMVNALQQAGGDAKLTIYPEAGHDSWTVTYNNPELYDWFLSHNKTITR